MKRVNIPSMISRSAMLGIMCLIWPSPAFAQTTNLVFSDNFEDDSVGVPPSNPQVGSYGQPSLSSGYGYVTNGSNPAPVDGTNCLFLERLNSTPNVFPNFTTNAVLVSGQIVTVHSHGWVYPNGSWAYIGLNTSGEPASDPDPGALDIVIEPDGSVQVYTAGGYVDKGLRAFEGSWNEYEVDYVVGATTVTVTMNGGTPTTFATSGPKPIVYGIEIAAYVGSGGAFWDDLSATVTIVPKPPPPSTLFRDGFENSQVGYPPGPSDPTVGAYSSDSYWALVMSGATFGGPDQAYSGQNYLMLSTLNAGATPDLSALFAGGSLPANSIGFKAEFFLWTPGDTTNGDATNYAVISVADGPLGAATPDLLETQVWPDLRWRYWNGMWNDSGLSLTANQWNDIVINWDGANATGTVNGSAPANLGLAGNPENGMDRLYFGTGGTGTVYYVDQISVSNTPPAHPPGPPHLYYSLLDYTMNLEAGPTPSTPEVGSYASGMTALVTDATTPGAHSGNHYLFENRSSGYARANAEFTSAVTNAGALVHAEAWVYPVGECILELRTSGEPPGDTDPGEIDAYYQGGVWTVYDGSEYASSGVTMAENTWSSVALDYTIGSSNLTVTANGQSAVTPISGPKPVVYGMVLYGYDVHGNNTFWDDLLVTVQTTTNSPAQTLFKDDFEAEALPPAMILSWAASGAANNWVLQTSSDLSNPSGWADAATGIQTPVVVPLTSPNGFYRIRHP